MRLQVPDSRNELNRAARRAPGLNHGEPRLEDPRNRDDGKRASAMWCGRASCRFTSGGPRSSLETSGQSISGWIGCPLTVAAYSCEQAAR